MENPTLSSLNLLAFFLLFSNATSQLETYIFSSATTSQLKTYIVHVRKPENGLIRSSDRRTWYKSFLPTLITSISGSKPSRMLYTYNHVISGFATRLTEEEVSEMSKKEGFLSSKPSHFYKVQTTHTPDFLGLNLHRGIWSKSKLGKGIIIGVLDIGIVGF